MQFQGKRILFIAPKFHDYEIMIQQELELLGSVVTFFPERSYSLKFSFINNFLKKSLPEYQNQHYLNILKDIKEERYDYLFVIRGYMLPTFFLEEFQKMNPNAIRIMYQWDSQDTNPFIHLKDYFENVKTFDFKDSSELELSYLPLFYTKDIRDGQEECVKEYDFFFMGFFFEERYEGVLKFREYCQEKGYTLFPFLYMPTRTRIKYFFKGRKLDRNIVLFKHMSRAKYLSTLRRTKVMVDVSNPRQTGLAMRVIESIACGTKVLTNNGNFKSDTKLKNSGVIELFDLNDIHIDDKFVESKCGKDVTLVLSMEKWLEKIFEINEH